MPTKLTTIHVTQGHIDAANADPNGQVNDGCPIFRALVPFTGGRVLVGADRLFVPIGGDSFNGDLFRTALPPEAAKFSKDIWHGCPVKPFSFEIDLSLVGIDTTKRATKP